MELLSGLIKKLLYFIPIVIVAFFIFLVVRFTMKVLNFPPIISTFGSRDILPPPGALAGKLKSAPTPSDKQTRPSMEELNPWMKDGTYNFDGKVVDYTQANSQVRNIVIGNNNTLKSGSLVRGSAREVFFVNGKFFVSLANSGGQIISTTVAMADKNAATNIWIPWSATLTYEKPLTNNCTLILQNQNTINGNPNAVKTIRIPVVCN